VGKPRAGGSGRCGHACPGGVVADRSVAAAAAVSTGLAATPTPTGEFRIASRYAVTTLKAPDYRIPAVPHVLCLGGGGLKADAVCIHPAPWQEQAGERFGVRRSQGCIRTSSATARWLFERVEVGTPVRVRE
jgi:lipoprotein-anchoring transpeptidase ErfK/SrfK